MCFKTLGGLLWITLGCGFPEQLRAREAVPCLELTTRAPPQPHPTPAPRVSHTGAAFTPLGRPLTFKS